MSTLAIGGFERDEGIDSSSGVITTLKNNKPSIGCSEQVYIPAEPWNSERGRRAADKNKGGSMMPLTLRCSSLVIFF